MHAGVLPPPVLGAHPSPRAAAHLVHVSEGARAEQPAQGQVAELMAMMTEFMASQSESQQANETQIEEEVAEAPAAKPKRKSRSKKK